MSAPDSSWTDLLDLALPALDHVFGPRPDRAAPPAWTLGGGTAIATRIEHRISHDVDLFVPSVALRLFTPARNPASARISKRYQWPGHYLKFERPEGEIDFLSPALQTVPGYTWETYRDRTVAIETLEEVIVKKIRYRSARFTARDVFNLAAVVGSCPELASVLAAEVPDALARTSEVVELHARRGLESIEAAIMLTPHGRNVLPRTFELARRVLEEAHARLRP